jgi:hypothetical protein
MPQKRIYAQEGPQVRPISDSKTLTAEGALNRRPRGQHIVATRTPAEPVSQMGSIVPHSAHAARRSHEYHEAIRATHTGGRQSSARITDQLNPDSSVSEDAANTGRRFPGLANG